MTAAMRHLKSVQRPLDPAAARIVERIAAEVCPEKLYLFGSRASGTADPESDVDVLLVHSGRESPREVQLKAHRLFPRPEVALDVFVMTPDEFESQKNVANTLAREVSETGILCGPVGSKVGGPRRRHRVMAGASQ